MNPWLILGVIGAMAVSAVGGAFSMHKVDNAALLKVEDGYKDAQLKAVQAAKDAQKREDDVSLKAAVDEAAAQTKIVTVTETITREVPIHVPAKSSCAVTVGFVRVLNGAVFGNGTADLSYAPGQSDGACAPLDARTLASSIVGNYATCSANAEQLTALQRWVGDTAKAAAGPR